MNKIYRLIRLPLLPVFLITMGLLMITSVIVHSSNVNAFIITTVDNIKGQYTMEVFKDICTSDAYNEFEFVRVTGAKDIYKKDCICEKYEAYNFEEGDKWLYKRTFWRVIEDCAIPDVINDLGSAVHGGIKNHQDTPENDRTQADKLTFNTPVTRDYAAGLSIYPNPARDMFVLDYQLKDGDLINMHLYDALGKEIILKENHPLQIAGDHSLTFDIADLQGGVYFYVITINSEKVSGRLIISD